jgi:hypothetical protein
MVAPGFINLTGQWQTRTIGVVHKTTSDIRHGTLHAHVHTQTVTVPPWKPRALGRAAPRRARHDFSCRPRSPSWKPRARGCASQSATWFLVQTHRMPHAGKPERDNTACLPKRAHAEMQAHVHRHVTDNLGHSKECSICVCNKQPKHHHRQCTLPRQRARGTRPECRREEQLRCLSPRSFL